MIRRVVQKRFATYTVEVYLTKDVKGLGKAGSLVECKPGRARLELIPQGLGVLMGEGKYRKQLPLIHQINSENMKHTPRSIEAELRRLLEFRPKGILEEYSERIAAPETNEVNALPHGENRVQAQN